MKELVDRRFGERGGVFWFYAFGPIFFAGLLIYFVGLYIQADTEGGESILFLAGTAILIVVLIVDSLAVYEARWIVRKAELDGDMIRLTPLWGRMFELPQDDIKEIRPARSFGYVPAISLLDNNRPNIEIVFKNRSSVFLFGSSEADQWISDLPKQGKEAKGSSL